MSSCWKTLRELLSCAIGSGLAGIQRLGSSSKGELRSPPFATAPARDSDGLDDLAEATAGTDPTDAASVLKILATERLADDRLALTWSSVPGKTYRVSRQEDLGNLESAEFSGPITATTVTTSWTNNLPFTLPALFLRIQVVPRQGCFYSADVGQEQMPRSSQSRPEGKRER